MANEAKFTEAQLRADMLAGLKPSDIARKHGVSPSAITHRVKRLGIASPSASPSAAPSASIAPEESRRYAARQIDVMEQLARNVQRANLLMDACDEWLRDTADPGKYDIGARADEIDVIYTVMIGHSDRGKPVYQRRKATLAHLLELLRPLVVADVQRVDSKYADPRELILKTQSETRQTVALVIDALQKLADARRLESLQETIVEEIAKESPDCARRIAKRIRQSIVLHAAFDGSGALHPGGEPSN